MLSAPLLLLVDSCVGLSVPERDFLALQGGGDQAEGVQGPLELSAEQGGGQILHGQGLYQGGLPAGIAGQNGADDPPRLCGEAEPVLRLRQAFVLHIGADSAVHGEEAEGGVVERHFLAAEAGDGLCQQGVQLFSAEGV